MPSFRAGLIARSAMGGAGVALSNATVAANATIGTTVGTLSVVGGTGTYTYSLTSNPGGLYAISGSNLNVAAALSPGTTPVTVQAAGGVPTPLSNVFAITVTPVPIVPANTVLPVISGSTAVGQTLTTTNGTWTGFPAPGFTYQWKRGGANISGATASSYLLVSADSGAMITVTVTATNTAGSASATSTGVGPIAVGGIAYTLTAQYGAYQFTGSNLTTGTDYALAPQTVPVALTGQSVTMTKGVAAAYTGPGEITGWDTAYGYWGLRGYTFAKVGANCIDVCSNPSGAPTSPVTMVIGANGYLSLANLPGYSPIYISKIYDQSGAQDLVTGSTNRPQLVTNKVGGLPAIYFLGSVVLVTSANATALAQPLSVAGILMSQSTSGGIYLTDGGFGLQVFIDRASSDVAHYAGSNVVDYTAGGVANGVFFSGISVLDSSGSNLSSMSLNGTITNASSIPNNPGSSGIGASVDKLTLGGISSGGASINGYVYEIVIKAGHVIPANQTALTANQRAIGTGF
jgi:hypothetical protein